MSWHSITPERWRREQEIASEILDECRAEIGSDGLACIRGVFNLYSQHGHLYEAVSLRIVYPTNFPARNQPPSVYLESHRDRWEKERNSHIESDWKLCLFVPAESGITFAADTSLNELFAVIHTFLLKERIYQQRLIEKNLRGGVAEWPGPDRSHGIEGIREAIQEIGGVGRNDACPCGSGKKFKKCHLGKL
ncbi:MAG: SEC-C metal-binding domain-containing protein [Candidatus Paceibacterota bacterium]